ncbi:MAG: hypothetical protein M9894_08850 [Planctomycetes bacterium]|nr:hypothetical protein [Planctomycetota bacterium]
MPIRGEPANGGGHSEPAAAREAMRRERSSLAQARAQLDRERAELVRLREQLEAGRDPPRSRRPGVDPLTASDPLEESWIAQSPAGGLQDWDDDEDLPRPRRRAGPTQVDRLVEAIADRVSTRLEARVAQAVHEALAREREALKDQREQLARTAALLERQRQHLEERAEALRQLEQRSLADTKQELPAIEPPRRASERLRPPSDRHRRA